MEQTERAMDLLFMKYFQVSYIAMWAKKSNFIQPQDLKLLVVNHVYVLIPPALQGY